MEQVVVYESGPASYMDVVKRLKEEGFNPVALGDPHTGAIYAPGCTYIRGMGDIVYIAVPREEKFGAEAVLRRWDEAQKSRIENISNDLNGQFLCSLLIVAIAAVVFVLSGIFLRAWLWLVAIWFATFVLIANVGKRSIK